jgi:hypothetical protein
VLVGRTAPLVLLVLLALAPSAARADEHPTIASDGLFVGGRSEPGLALTLAYDLDIYLTDDRVISLGPAASFSFLGEDGSELGRRQEYLLAIDFLRLKVAMNDGHGPLRPYLFVGGGMSWARLPAQTSPPRDVLLVPDGTPAVAVTRFDAIDDLGALLSVGGGLDVYLVDSFGVALALAGHVRLSEADRLPLFWAEALVGVRFGM